VGADDLTNRRGLLRQLAVRAADGAKELRAARIALRPPGAPETGSEGAAGKPPPVEVPPAQLPLRAVDDAELAELVREHGLEKRVHDVRRLCRSSLRIAAAPRDTPIRSEVTGAPALGARIDLVEATAAGNAELRSARTLSVQLEPADAPKRAPWDAGACRVTLEAAGEYGQRGARPVALARELVLPRVWSAPVAALDLDPDEQGSWEALRRSLAAAHGVEPFDVGPARPIHRLFGWPDERGGWMPLASAMLAAGLELGHGPPPAHAPTDELAAAAMRWRLLLQLSGDPALGITTPAAGQRLYVWVDERELAANDLSRARAFLV
jgi:hypothetical protein